MRNRREISSIQKLAAQKTAHFWATLNWHLLSFIGNPCRRLSRERSWLSPAIIAASTLDQHFRYVPELERQVI
jgi:hypothetical protein